MEKGLLEGLAGDLAGLEKRTRGEAGFFLPFEDGNDQGVCLDLPNRGCDGGNIHYLRLCHERPSPLKFQKWNYS